MALASTKVDVWNIALDLIGESHGLSAETDNRPAALICARHHDNVVRHVLEHFPWPFARWQQPLTAVYLDYETDATYADGDVVRDAEVLYTSLGGVDEYDVTATYGVGDFVKVAATGHVYSSVQAANTGNLVSDIAWWADLGVNIGRDLTDTTWWAAGDSVYVGWESVYVLPTAPLCVTPLALLAEGARLEQLQVSERLPFELHGNLAGDGRVLCTNAVQADDDFDVLEYTALIENVAVWTTHFLNAVAWGLAEKLALGLKKDRAEADYCAQRQMLALREARAEALNARQEAPEPMSPSIAARM